MPLGPFYMVWDAPAMANGPLARSLETLRAGARRWGRAVWTSLFLAIVFGPPLVEHVENASDRFRFADDARILIPPLYRAQDGALFPNDPVTDYYLAGLPDAPRLLYALFAPLVGPEAQSKILPYVL